MQWNFTIQKQIGANVFTVAYVGELGRHLQLCNRTQICRLLGTAVTPAYIRAATLPNITGITLYSTGGASEYNAAQFIFERRYSKGLTVNANYVFARNLTSLTDIAEPIGNVINQPRLRLGQLQHRLQAQSHRAHQLRTSVRQGSYRFQEDRYRPGGRSTRSLSGSPVSRTRSRTTRI